MTKAFASQPVATRSAVGDSCLVVLALVLCGYAMFGKTFAYLGVAPLYVGEMAFAFGIVALLHSRCCVATLATPPILLLVVLMSWALMRTLPYIGEFGFDAARDSVIILYGGFAIIVTALLLEKPERLSFTIKFLRGLSTVLVPIAPFLLLVSDARITNYETTFVKPGDVSVQLAGAALLVLFGFRRAKIAWLTLLLAGMAIAASQNRGGMLAIICMLIFALLASGRLRELSLLLVIVAMLIGIGYVLGLSIPTGRTRDISAEQLVDNLASIVNYSTDMNLSGTETWRMQWWTDIINYTFHGPYFWFGKGFGINLAIDDGVISGRPGLTPLTRSPHNGHLTILARTGVPGLTLWLLTLACWGAVVLTNMLRARVHGDNAWADFFLLIFCYELGFVINAAFDVALEGPMVGIWFWCMFGIGTGASMIYRAKVRRTGFRYRQSTSSLATAIPCSEFHNVAGP
jgi:hypothetical protein